MITTVNDFKKNKKSQINEARYIRRTEEDDVNRQNNIENRKNRKIFDIDEPTDDDAIKEDGLMPYKSTLNTDWIEMKIDAREPFFIMGSAGWGKTSIIKKVAKAHGLSIITVYLDKALPEDLGGIPIASKSKDGNTNYVDNALPKWAQYIYEHPEDDFLLFFDEMNQASPDVQNALMPILLESTIGGIKFDNIWFGAAGNYAKENASISDLSAPLKSRFIKENIWNENWEDAFEYIIEKFKDKLPDTLLDVITKYNICLNPRELENMLKAVVSYKKNNKKYSIESLMNRFNDYNKMDKSAETKKTVETIFVYLNTSDEVKSEQESTTKKPQIKRAVLSQAHINKYVSLIKQRGFVGNDGKKVDLSGDWKTALELTPEEAELVKKALEKAGGVPNIATNENISKPILSQKQIDFYIRLIKQGGYINTDGKPLSLKGNDWKRNLDLNKQEIELIDKELNK